MIILSFFIVITWAVSSFDVHVFFLTQSTSERRKKKVCMDAIRLYGIKVHNLKNIDVAIPYGKLTVLSGISGSGKSSLALDTLFAEGQRRFIESLSAYVRQFLERMERPDVERVSGMLPAVCIESRNTIVNARSTVGTHTEINDYLRILFARIGKTYCFKCGTLVRKDTPQDIVQDMLHFPPETRVLITFPVHLGGTAKKYATQYVQELKKQGFVRVYWKGMVADLDDTEKLKQIFASGECAVVVDRVNIKKTAQKRLIDSLETAYKLGKGHLALIAVNDDPHTRKAYSNLFHCADCDLSFRELTPHMFSFNSPVGACPECQGFGRIITIDIDRVIPDRGKSIQEGAIVPWTTKAGQWEFEQLRAFCKKRKISLTKPFRLLKAKDQRDIIEGTDDFCGINGFFAYLAKKKYKMHVRVFLSRYRAYVICPTCNGSRLKDHAAHVKISDKNIQELSSMTIRALHEFFDTIDVSAHEKKIAATVLDEIKSRIRFLKDVGLDYLRLDRLSRTLSGGEAQRINLASALGAKLVDTLYVLDEPSVGLHARDHALLIGILKALKKLGNTVVVIEHDKDMIEQADTVIDLGPGAGEKGGHILYSGTYKGLCSSKQSLTARYIRKEETISLQKKYLIDKRNAGIQKKTIVVHGATEHNLKDLSVTIPLGRLVVLTGVSGSGKSTLMHTVIYNNFLRSRGRAVSDVGIAKKIKGYEHIGDMILIDQAPIGRTPRSNPVTFIDAYSSIRTVFSATRGAKLRKRGARDFSFNVEGGRCETCKGDGRIKVEMHFLADMFIECEACQGKRFKKEILEITYNGKNIHEVLQLTVDEALMFFEAVPRVKQKIQVLHDVGLGYLQLGQPAPTLSAGEAQRLKLAVELREANRTNTLFLFDEPTVGLHYHDIKALLGAIEKLLECGNSIMMIEHNMEVIKCADYIIDLGPEGGENGGALIGCGSPAYIARLKKSYTATFLRDYL
jgi:excinuclease ABC subunit A